MSEISQTSVVNAIDRLTALMQINLNKLILAVVNNTKWISQLIVIGRRNLDKSTFFKGMSKLQISKKIEGISTPITQGIGPKQALGGIDKKTVKNSKKFFGNMGKSMKGMMKGSAQMALMSLAMEPLNAMISAFLEPMEMLTPLFEAWGSILSQLLIPIVIVLMDVLMPLTPVFISLVEALMPLILLTVSIIGWLVPLIELLAAMTIALLNLVSIITNSLSILTVLSEGIRVFFATFFGFFTDGWKWISDGLAEIANGIKNFWDNIINGVKDATGNLFDIIEETWEGLTSIFRTKETGGIW